MVSGSQRPDAIEPALGRRRGIDQGDGSGDRQAGFCQRFPGPIQADLPDLLGGGMAKPVGEVLVQYRLSSAIPPKNR